MFPTLTATSVATVALAVIVGWTLLFQMPKLRRQLNQASADASARREALAALEKQVASATQAETNVPLVMLQATRDVQAAPNEVIVPSGAKHESKTDFRRYVVIKVLQKGVTDDDRVARLEHETRETPGVQGIEDLRVRWLDDEDPARFANLNTPDDYERFLARLIS